MIEATYTQIQAEWMRRDFERFIPQAWKIVEPHTPFLSNWHIGLIAEYLIAVHLGEINRIIFNIPPRHMKSREITTFFPVWEWIDSPWLRYLFSSYNVDLARDHSRERRAIIESDWYQERWGDKFEIVSDQNQVTYFANDQGGRMQARGTNTGSTGKGGNRIIIDDPHNTKQSESKVQREQAITDFKQNLSTRLDQPKTDAIIVVMQRLHYNDLSGFILRELDGYEHVSVPSIADKHTIITFPRSKRVIERNTKDLLWPERQGKKELDAQRRLMGTNGFNAQFQQKPIPEGGNRIKIAWFPRYKRRPEDVIERVHSWDTANKSIDTAAYTVCHMFEKAKDGQWYLYDIYREQVGYPDLKKASLKLANRDNPTAILIEDKASGTSLIQDLRALDKSLPIIPIEPATIGDKVVRMDTASPHCEAGSIAIPEWAYWLADWEAEISTFPESERMDQIDSLSQFINWKFGLGGQIIMKKLSGG